MSKARLSVGNDTPTGEPASGPAGPYVTDEHDDELAAALGSLSPRPEADPVAAKRARPKGPKKSPARPEKAGSED
jgi:hypothetical protein